jgi:peptidoglycan/LPS O-acetylase OafA/YrhL
MGTLRALLAISVIFAHTRTPGIWGWTIVGGDVAVQCFYVVSGFFITLILNEKYVTSQDNRAFYINRGIRIYGLYFLCLLLYLPVDLAGFLKADKGAIAFWVQYFHQFKTWDALYLIFANIFLFGLDYTSFLRLAHSGLQWTSNFHLYQPGVYNFTVIPQAWTLSLELSFYLIAPFIVRLRTRWIILISGASLVLRIAGHFGGLQADPWGYRFFPFELSMFLAGSLAYRAYSVLQPMHIPKIYQAAAFSIFPMIALYQFYGSAEQNYFTFGKILLFLVLLGCLPLLFRATKNSHIDRFLGELSYPIYLVHVAVLNVVGNIPQLSRGYTESSKLLALVVVLGASTLIAIYIEIPINRLRHRIAPTGAAPTPIIPDHSGKKLQ